MTDLTVTELRSRILAFCDDSPRTVQEIQDHVGIDRDILTSIMLRMVSAKEIVIAPGTCGKKWISAARAQLLRVMGAEA